MREYLLQNRSAGWKSVRLFNQSDPGAFFPHIEACGVIGKLKTADIDIRQGDALGLSTVGFPYDRSLVTPAHCAGTPAFALALEAALANSYVTALIGPGYVRAHFFGNANAAYGQIQISDTVIEGGTVTVAGKVYEFLAPASTPTGSNIPVYCSSFAKATAQAALRAAITAADPRLICLPWGDGGLWETSPNADTMRIQYHYPQFIGNAVNPGLIDTDAANVLTAGFNRASESGSAGNTLYLWHNLGTFTTQPPFTPGALLQRVGIQLSADEFFFNPEYPTGVVPEA